MDSQFKKAGLARKAIVTYGKIHRKRAATSNNEFDGQGQRSTRLTDRDESGRVAPLAGTVQNAGVKLLTAKGHAGIDNATIVSEFESPPDDNLKINEAHETGKQHVVPTTVTARPRKLFKEQNRKNIRTTSRVDKALSCSPELPESGGSDQSDHVRLSAHKAAKSQPGVKEHTPSAKVTPKPSPSDLQGHKIDRIHPSPVSETRLKATQPLNTDESSRLVQAKAKRSLSSEMTLRLAKQTKSPMLSPPQASNKALEVLGIEHEEGAASRPSFIVQPVIEPPARSVAQSKKKNPAASLQNPIQSPQPNPHKIGAKRQLTPPNRSRSSVKTPRRADPCVPGKTANFDLQDSQHDSPRGRSAWDGILQGSTELTDNSSRKKRTNPSLKSTAITRTPTKLRIPQRKRLIDTLLQQAAQLDEQISPMSAKADSVFDSEAEQPAANSQSTTLTREPSSISQSNEHATHVPATQQGLVRRTYGTQRSWLPEHDLFDDLAIGLSTSNTASQTLSEGVEDEEGVAKANIMSFHELRQAGANSRFDDEVRDYLDRIGSPAATNLSKRRSGLLELADKMQDKDFVHQFHAGGYENKLFVHLGQESDVIAGYIMITLLVRLLEEMSLPHIIAPLRRQGIARLLIRLLSKPVDIVKLGKERKSNMSKISLSMLASNHQMLAVGLFSSDTLPTLVTSQLLALKCLDIMVRQTRQAGIANEIMSKELTTSLFDIVRSTSIQDALEIPLELTVSLSILELHSLSARTVQDEQVWMDHYLPTIADTLQHTLNCSNAAIRPAQLSLLRLTLNVTNNNNKASEIFARSNLMTALGTTIIESFADISKTDDASEFARALDRSILVLGVMINFAESGTAALNCLKRLKGRSDDPLDKLVMIFTENQERASEVMHCHSISFIITNYL